MSRGLKGVFCYDEPVLIDEQGRYYSSTMDSRSLEKYLQLVDSLVICMPTKFFASSEHQKENLELDEARFQLKSVLDLSTLRSFLFERRHLKKQLVQALEEADILIARLPSLVGYLAIDVARVMGKPYLLEVVECAWSSSWHHSIRGKLFAMPSFLMMRRRVKQASHTMYVTQYFLQQRYPSKGTMLSCSDANLPESDELVLLQRDVKIARRHIREPIVLGTVAAVDVKNKAQQDIFEAMARLKEEGYRFRYKLVGDGNQRNLRKHVERLDLVGEVDFLGPLSQGELLKFLNEIDVYVQPSKAEGLPKALLEAMSRGCPAIGTNVGGIPELLERGAIYEAGEIEELCSLLRESVAKNWMYERAKVNFKRARFYESEHLAAIREVCYAEVRSICLGK